MITITPPGWKQEGPPPIIHLHGSGNFYVPGRRVSVLDVMMWKMYGTPSPYIIEAPKLPDTWRIMTSAAHWPGIKDNPEIKVLWTSGDIETVQETIRLPHYPFFDVTIYNRRTAPSIDIDMLKVDPIAVEELKKAWGKDNR